MKADMPLELTSFIPVVTSDSTVQVALLFPKVPLKNFLSSAQVVSFLFSLPLLKTIIIANLLSKE